MTTIPTVEPGARSASAPASAGKSAEAWLPLVTIRPDPAAGRFQVSDALQHQRAVVRAADLLDLVAPRHTESTDLRNRRDAVATAFRAMGWLPGTALDERVLASLRRWWQRGWHPSLTYYLWSRHRTYQDARDGEGDIRRTTLRRYLDDGPPPARRCVPGEPVPLPEPAPLPPEQTVAGLLLARRSVRAYTREPVDLARLSGVLHHGFADLRAVRALPKDEALNWLRSHGTPFDIYLVSYGVQGLAPGVYLYRLEEHSLVEVEPGDHRERMCRVLIGMRAPETATWTLVLVADFRQYQWRYRHERALRHLYMSAGRIAQRVIVVGQAFGLGSLPTPAACDLDACRLLGIDPEHSAPVYTLTMGPLRAREEGRHA